MNAILSIKPKFADKILNGEKRFEYRKVIFNRRVNKVFLYASYPVSRLVGEFCISKVLCEEPNTLWNMTYMHSGINKSYFDDYFPGRSLAYAIEISTHKRYKSPINPKNLIKDFRAPQSFCYTEIENV